MFQFNHVAKAALLGLGMISLGACSGVGRLDPYVGTPYGYATAGDQLLTKVAIDHQDTVVQPRCETWAKETTPNAWKMASAYGINHGVAGAGGTVAGYMAEGAFVAAPVNMHSAVAIGIAAGVQSGANAAMSGLENHDAQVHNSARSCLIADVGGYHYVPPSEGKKIKDGKQGPTSYGPPLKSRPQPPVE